MTDATRSAVVAERPVPGTPSRYDFPAFERGRLINGMTLLTSHLDGRALVSAALVMRNGASDEPAPHAGATILAARALSEGTERYDAIAFVEAAERLGASLHAEAGWDATTVWVDVPGERLEPALELLADMAAHPTFPLREVERLRDERLNDLLQARADPRRRAEEAFVETIYTKDSPYHRPAGGTRESVTGLDQSRLRAAHARGFDPSRWALIVGGDLRELDVPSIAERLFADWGPHAGATAQVGVTARSAVSDRLVRVIHRPGAVQTEIRVGHLGLPRRIPDFHAVSVMSAILGGLFNSRLNMKLREEKGYTYGAFAGFDMRRGRGPFAARAAVNTDATVPAVADIVTELSRMRDQPVTDAELRGARDFLVGVFPLRFETPGPVVGALSGLIVHGLPDDELARYRPAIEAVTPGDVHRAAREHLDVERAAIVLVGDVDAFGSALEEAGFGPIVVERDEGPVELVTEQPSEEEIGPVDQGPAGPTEGAEDPSLDGRDEPTGGENLDPQAG